MPEVFGVRLPPASDCLTAVDFDLLPNRPPPDVKLYDEEIEEIAESDSEEEGDYEEDEPSTTATGINQTFRGSTLQSEDTFMEDPGQPVGPISALTPSDVDMLATPVRALAQEEEEEDPLFGDEGDEPMDAAPASSPAGGVKRKLELDEDYD
jgi:transcription initiation factor TFIID subunit 9B